MIGLIMFCAALLLLAVGYPVGFTFGSVSIFFGIMAAMVEVAPDITFFAVSKEFLQMFSMMPFRVYSIMNNTILMAIPLFILMGIILQKSQLAEKLLEAMGTMFGKVRGGIAVSTILVGTMLAASTGVVGASVVAMGVISLPVMLKYGYSKSLVAGTICAAGTLGQIIPPSVVLIVLGDIFQLPVGDLFQSAFGPGLVLVGLYIVFILIYSFIKKDVAPAMPAMEGTAAGNLGRALVAVLPPLILIFLVLGSIFMGIATPTESAAVGSIGAMILAAMYRKLSWKVVEEAALETVKITAMVFAILIGATAFSMVFLYSGADTILEEALVNLPGQKYTFLFLVMLVIFLLGFFIDFFEICYIVVPVLLPISQVIGIEPLFFAILIALNLQTSFLTPPFGYALFYLAGVAPKGVDIGHIYRGIVPFIALQVIGVAVCWIFPQVILWLPHVFFGN